MNKKEKRKILIKAILGMIFVPLIYALMFAIYFIK